MHKKIKIKKQINVHNKEAYLHRPEAHDVLKHQVQLG